MQTGRLVVSHMHFVFGFVIVLEVDVFTQTAHQIAFGMQFLVLLVFVEGEVCLPEGGGHHTLGPAHVLSHAHMHTR